MNLNELNEQSYSELEEYWVHVFLNLLKEQDKEKWIIPYYNTSFSNGQKIMDMNPIFRLNQKRVTNPLGSYKKRLMKRMTLNIG